MPASSTPPALSAHSAMALWPHGFMASAAQGPTSMVPWSQPSIIDAKLSFKGFSAHSDALAPWLHVSFKGPSACALRPKAFPTVLRAPAHARFLHSPMPSWFQRPSAYPQVHGPAQTLNPKPQTLNPKPPEKPSKRCNTQRGSGLRRWRGLRRPGLLQTEPRSSIELRV